MENRPGFFSGNYRQEFSRSASDGHLGNTGLLPYEIRRPERSHSLRPQCAKRRREPISGTYVWYPSFSQSFRSKWGQWQTHLARHVISGHDCKQDVSENVNMSNSSNLKPVHFIFRTSCVGASSSTSRVLETCRIEFILHICSMGNFEIFVCILVHLVEYTQSVL